MFSPRPNTPAARMDDDVPAEEKNRRLHVLNDLMEEISGEINATYLDTYAWVLYQQHDYAGARPYLEQATKDTRDASILEHYGDVNDLIVFRRPHTQCSVFIASLDLSASKSETLTECDVSQVIILATRGSVPRAKQLSRLLRERLGPAAPAFGFGDPFVRIGAWRPPWGLLMTASLGARV